MTTTLKVLVVSFCSAVLVVLGVLYLRGASDRVDEDIAARADDAERVIDAFEAGEALSSDSTTESSDSATDTASREAAGGEPAASTAADNGSMRPGDVLVVHRVPGDDYGRLALRRSDGTRTLLDRRCVRVAVSAGSGVCLEPDDSAVVPAWRTVYFDADAPGLPELRSYASSQPSRARMSPDGTIASTTGFLRGQGYEDIGAGTETSIVIEWVDGSDVLTGMFEFEVLGDDPALESDTRQFWGVSFTDNDEFWVTGWFGDDPQVLRGSVSRRVLDPQWEGSCPSVSPDGSTLVFKEMLDDGSFRLAAVDIESGERWILGETRSVDDQVEWLDDDTILYALHPDGTDDRDVDPQFDIWSLDIAPDAEPELFLPAADSPAVIR